MYEDYGGYGETIDDNTLKGFIFREDVSGNAVGTSGYIELPGIDNTELLESIEALSESLQVSQYYGSIGDYYNGSLGFTVFPDYETYEYFIDTDAMGGEWACASDGHYVKLVNLDAYEEYISSDRTETGAAACQQDDDILETLQSINGLLTKIDAGQSEYLESLEAYREESLAWQEIQTYSVIGGAVLIGVVAGCLLAESFFGKMRLG